MNRKIYAFIKSMRPKHWIKNGLLFLPAFFGGAIHTWNDVINLIWGGLSFSLIASAIYLINDVHDAQKDALHPVKRMRPIASGELGKTEALVGAITLIVLGVGVLMAIAGENLTVAMVIIVIYIVTNFLYSIFGWKNVPVLDIALVSSGYILRILLGGLLSDVFVSVWLFVTVMCISFFMSAEKRRKELEHGTDYRGVLKDYSQRYLSMVALISMVSGIVFFVLWSIEVASNRRSIYFPYISSSIGFVGSFLYLYDTEISDTGDPVEIILHDKAIIVMSLLLVVAFIARV